jgi:aminopeptidase N
LKVNGTFDLRSVRHRDQRDHQQQDHQPHDAVVPSVYSSEMRLSGWLLVLGACGDNAFDFPVKANLGRDILSTDLSIDVTAQHGTAAIAFAADTRSGATLEIGDLTINAVTVGGVEIETRQHDGLLDLGIPESAAIVSIDYDYVTHDRADGVSPNGYTLVWPYFCENIFPCHTEPSDGSAFTLELTGVPAGKTAVYPTSIPDAPAYQLAWSIADLTEIQLGTTQDGTEIVGWYLPSLEPKLRAGTTQLVDAFDWYEQNLGPYQFGPKAGTVAVSWEFPGIAPDYVLGGMEHHPFWHINESSLRSSDAHIHEAGHGWFGDGVRIGCWEDMVLSEGTITYLTGRVLDVIQPGNTYFTSIARALTPLPDVDHVWPRSCGVVDGIAMINTEVYIRGAMFYRALALKLGADEVDTVLRTFYEQHMLRAARFSDMLATIEAVTGYDASACAETWLRTIEVPPVAACD